MKAGIVFALSVALFATSAFADVGYTYERTALRSGPGSNYKLLANIPAHTKIDMRECKAGWCRVRWNGKAGYARYASIDYEDDYDDCMDFGDC